MIEYWILFAWYVGQWYDESWPILTYGNNCPVSIIQAPLLELTRFKIYLKLSQNAFIVKIAESNKTVWSMKIDQASKSFNAHVIYQLSGSSSYKRKKGTSNKSYNSLSIFNSQQYSIDFPICSPNKFLI